MTKIISFFQYRKVNRIVFEFLVLLAPMHPFFDILNLHSYSIHISFSYVNHKPIFPSPGSLRVKHRPHKIYFL